ncbi:MAG: 3-phosphoshikimate 1-carboxyvinyltransferase [Spirochaetales bacterium]|nr:3-phosphoshikimate 1-carboxyvinyltransferase [Spirochaetales bacterium]
MKFDRVTFRPSALSGTVTAPPSKSMAHRLLVCASLAEGTSTIDNLDLSQDIRATISCCETLGARISICGRKATVLGTGGVFPGTDGPGKRDFFCNESGSTLRFFIPLALLGSGAFKGESVFHGSPTLMTRPLSVYEDLFRKRGICFTRGQESVTVSGSLESGVFEIKENISSQFVSGLLFALPLLGGDSRIILAGEIGSRPYMDMTLCALKQAGISASWDGGNSILVPGNQKFRPFDAAVEGDWSNAAFFYAMNTFGARISVEGLPEKSIQGDSICVRHFDELCRGFGEIDISDCPDLGPVLFAVAAGHHGGRFTGTDRLRIKESDRGSAMCAELAKMGIKTESGEDCITVYGAEPVKPGTALCSHNDHRIAMALSVLLVRTGGTIDGTLAVNKSFPDFFGCLEQTGADMTYGGELI